MDPTDGGRAPPGRRGAAGPGPLRLIHFADLHLGVEAGGRPHPATGLNQRIHDVCDRLDELCDVAERDGVHAVIFAGDAFKNQHPTPTAQSLFAARMRRLARGGTAVFLLVGNHDLPKMAGLVHPFAIYDALEVERVMVGDKAAVYRLILGNGAPAPELQVAALPHFSRAQVLARLPEGTEDPDDLIEQRVADTVRDLGRQIDPEQPAIFAGHCHVSQAEIGDGQMLFGISDVEVSLSTLTSGQPFPYYALGHIHHRQVLATDPFVAYSGSLERVDFGEGDRVTIGTDGSVDHRPADDKGFFRFDLVPSKGGWTLAAPPVFTPVGARPFVTIRLGALDASDPAADLAARVAKLAGTGVGTADAFVRISATVDSAGRGRLTPALARDLLAHAYDVRLALETRDSPVVRDPRFAAQMTEVVALEHFLETRDDWSEDRADILRAGRALIEEVLTDR